MEPPLLAEQVYPGTQLTRHTCWETLILFIPTPEYLQRPYTTAHSPQSRKPAQRFRFQFKACRSFWISLLSYLSQMIGGVIESSLLFQQFLSSMERFSVFLERVARYTKEKIYHHLAYKGNINVQELCKIRC